MLIEMHQIMIIQLFKHRVRIYQWALECGRVGGMRGGCQQPVTACQRSAILTGAASQVCVCVRSKRRRACKQGIYTHRINDIKSTD